jgi:hypothetical protein
MKQSLLMLMFLCSASAFAELNKWVDANGKVQYSDMPAPANAKSSTLHSAARAEDAAVSAPVASRSVVEREADWKKSQHSKKEAADKAAREQAKKDETQSNCTIARQNLKTLQQDIRIVEVGADGERRDLDDVQRQQRIEKSQQDINKFCL